MKKIKIQIISIKCQYQQIIVNWWILLLNELILLIIIVIIINVPIITWVIWNKVRVKKLEKKILLDELKFINLYSINWIEIKYNLKIIVKYKYLLL